MKRGEFKICVTKFGGCKLNQRNPKQELATEIIYWRMRLPSVKEKNSS